MAGNIVIELQNVSKRFDSLTAVDQTSLQLTEGEFFALLGPSGCGKTTLLRMIAGFETPDEGTILLDGRDITGDAANIRPINLMFQSYALFPHMSVHANISYGLEMERLSRAEIRQRVGEMIELTQLTELSARRPNQLSGGQRQRVALARALIKKPRVLLLDEPLGALDRKLREQMQLELKRLQHELGITFVVVTHDQEEALVMADRIALMNAGNIAQLGAPEAIYENPASRFVAQFVGVTNLFDGELSSNGIELDGLGSFSSVSPAPPGTSCTLSVRPERFELSLDKPLPDGNAVLGTLFDKAYHGQDMSLLFTIDNRDTLLTVRTSAADQAAQHYSVGQQIWCNWRPENGRVLTD